ncbi:MAG: hypothetical protein FWH53_06115 [Leptospirales bacterium]|nr:hypothetical protein [Leptospirales bacterium]
MNKILTMNNKMKCIFFGFLILLTGMAFYGCSNSSFESVPETPQTGTGYFVLTNGSAGADRETLHAQTIMPEKPVVTNFALYELMFSPRGTNSNPAKTVKRDSTDLGDPVELATGTWDLVVYAYKNGLDTQPTAQGDLLGVIDIKNGGTSSGNVTLTTFVSGGAGTFNWTINWPSGVTISGSDAKMIITPLNGGTEQTVYFSNGTPDTYSLDSGYYRVFVELTNSAGQTAGLRETLHIHRNMESNFTHTFTNSSFFAPLSIMVSIGVQVGGENGDCDWTDPCVGETLVANISIATPGLKYQWYRGATPISGATGATYTFTSADIGAGTNDFSVMITCNGYNGIATDSLLALTVVEEPDGTATKPFRIYNETDLRDVGKAAAPKGDWTLSASYRLMRNITLTGTWTPIGGQSTQYTGTFDGNGKTIADLTITGTTANYLGLFGHTDTGSEVMNLALVDVNISVTDSNNVGGIAGYNRGTIQNCYVTGSVSSTTTSSTASTPVGGIAGNNTGSVKNCYTIITVTGRANVAGIAGTNQTGGTIQECVALGQSVSVTASTAAIGRVEGSYPSPSGLANNYASSNMEAYVSGSISSTAFSNTNKTLTGNCGENLSIGNAAIAAGYLADCPGGAPDLSAYY